MAQKLTFVDTTNTRVASSILDVAASMQRREIVGVYGSVHGQRGMYNGVVNTIEAEAGNGRNFNITFTDGTCVFVTF